MRTLLLGLLVRLRSKRSVRRATAQDDEAISGRVTFPHPLSPLATAYISFDSEAGGRGVGMLLPPDGTFKLNLGGAEYRPRLGGSVPMYIAEMTGEGAPVKYGLVDMRESTGVRLKIVAGDDMGRVKGFAMNGDKPAPAVLVVLAPKTESGNPTDYRGFQTESDGSFDYTAVRAGDYLLFAIDRFDLEYTNPAVVRPYLGSAIAVQVGAQAVVEQNVPLTVIARQ